MDDTWNTFNQIRTKHNENICSETNKLILRLDKLINTEETDIEWAPDDLVKLCPSCGVEFNLARRRHHCRVCGAITCNSCSKFLDHRKACKLVKPAKLYTDRYDRIEDRLRDKQPESEPPIRTCDYCKSLLDKRIAVIEDYYSQPMIVEFYEKLRLAMNEADDLILAQASPTPELKHKIHDCRQTIASMGLKVKKMADCATGKQAFLLKSINQSILSWLKESVELKSNRINGTRVDRSNHQLEYLASVDRRSINHPGLSGWVSGLLDRFN